MISFMAKAVVLMAGGGWVGEERGRGCGIVTEVSEAMVNSHIES